MTDLYFAGLIAMMLLAFATLYLGSGEDRLSTRERFSMFVILFAMFSSVWSLFYAFLWLLAQFILGGFR